ncbi:MAG TPA: prepilin peptidase [Rhizomicrobium sp.]
MSGFPGTYSTDLAWAAIIASPVIGSFLGLAIERLPAGRPLVWGRSECESCRHVLGPLDLIPFASWLLSRGRCRYCHARLSVFYPLIELAALLVAVWSASAVTGLRLVAGCLIGWLLLVVTAIAWRSHKKLYWSGVLFAVWLILLYAPLPGL